MNTVRDLSAFIEGDAGLRALRAEAARRLSEDPGHDLAHAMRVALWTIRLGGEEVDPRQAVAAALCHDLVNVPKNSAHRAEASTHSANLARELLPGYQFTDTAIATIADAIRDHSYSRGAVPSSPLGRALQDADRLDALGAIGIMRTISTGARMGGKYFDPEDPWATGRPLDDKAYSIDHFFKKLLHLQATMCTAAGRAEAARRTAVLERFLDDLALEIGAPRP